MALGYKVGATGVGNLDANTSWVRSRTSGKWRKFSDRKRVVFFTGIKINYWPIIGAKSQEDSGWRGGEDKFVIELDSKRSFEVEMEDFGKDWDEIKDDKDDD